MDEEEEQSKGGRGGKGARGRSIIRVAFNYTAEKTIIVVVVEFVLRKWLARAFGSYSEQRTNANNDNNRAHVSLPSVITAHSSRVVSL